MSMSKTEVVMDTNVPIVANGNKTEQAGPCCILACIKRLRHIRDECLLLLDDRKRIIDESGKKLNRSGQPGPGDAFFLWLWQNQANPEYCRKIALTPHEDRGFEEFPDDPDLSAFDQDDRKFVAVALASGTEPEVLNASDTGWWHHRQALQQHGVEIVFLCPELMQRRGATH